LDLLYTYTQLENISNCSAIANSHSSQPAVSSAVFWKRLPTANVPLPLGSRTVSVSQLPASNSNSSQRLNSSSPVTYSSTNSLHSTNSRVRVRVTSRLAVYRQSVRLSAKPLEAYNQRFPALTNCLAYNITARTAQKTMFLCFCSIVA
jgi:hypothetical protein